MQFYARFQDEVVAAPATVAEHVERARERDLPRLPQDLRRGAGRGPRAPRRRARDLAAKVRFVTLYHLILESTLGLTTFKFVTEYLDRRGAAARASSTATRRSTTTRPATSATASGSCARRSAPTRPRPSRSAGLLRELLPSVAESLEPAAVTATAPTSARSASSSDELREFALGGLTRRLEIIGVPIATL